MSFHGRPLHHQGRSWLTMATGGAVGTAFDTKIIWRTDAIVKVDFELNARLYGEHKTVEDILQIKRTARPPAFNSFVHVPPPPPPLPPPSPPPAAAV